VSNYGPSWQMNEDLAAIWMTLRAWPARNLRCGAKGWNGPGRTPAALTSIRLDARRPDDCGVNVSHPVHHLPNLVVRDPRQSDFALIKLYDRAVAREFEPGEQQEKAAVARPRPFPLIGRRSGLRYSVSQCRQNR
jgi:hypothetical protein